MCVLRRRPPPIPPFFPKLVPIFVVNAIQPWGGTKGGGGREGGHWKTVTLLPQAGRQGPNPGGSWDEPAPPPKARS